MLCTFDHSFGLAPCICAKFRCWPLTDTHSIMIFHSTSTLPFLPHHLPGSSFRSRAPRQNTGSWRSRRRWGTKPPYLGLFAHYSLGKLRLVPWIEVSFPLLVVLPSYRFSRETPATRIISTLQLTPTLELKLFKPMVRSYIYDRSTECGCAVVPNSN